MKRFDFVVVGSGFSGSITAMALTRSGFSVGLIEKDQHPRFAIGESSTPIADMILRDIAQQFDLSFLKKLSRYGDWQRNYPEVTCGLKRGFSYYYHRKGEVFKTDQNHSRELLVAASENDRNSDTNWLRSNVDHFLVQKAIRIGVQFMDNTTIQNLTRDSKNSNWRVQIESTEEFHEIKCKWIIDATGNSKFAIKHFYVQSGSTDFHTNSSAIFSHFENTRHWSDYLKSNQIDRSDYPYNPDNSALHQIIEEGWIWMLRFKNNRLSAGILMDEASNLKKSRETEPDKIWNSIVKKYPSIANIFEHARPAEMPNTMIQTARLQRKLNQMYGDGWVVLPHTAGFVDPLHSTGIAYTLSGVETLLKIFTDPLVNNPLKSLKKYQDKVSKELQLIDLLVSMCYKSRDNFDLFTACTMLYFVASIQYEQHRLNGVIPDTFLCAGEKNIMNLIESTFNEINMLSSQSPTQDEINHQIEKIRVRIEPYNTVGLMNPELHNMYTHTAVNL